MKTANVYEIERALQQPITPQQRQTAAANNPVAALLAQRLDGVEGSLRTKMQTPPPPQGTVMNQYYQWPQQQPEMGLAQPGLEQMAQQYAAGGLVAFAEGGHTGYGDDDNMLFDTDGSAGYAGYADGGLATMLPMGYAGEDDVPVYGYARGEEVKLHQYPWRTLGESVEPTIVDDTAEDEDAFWEDMPDIAKLEDQGIRERPTPSAASTAGMSNDKPWPINPSAIQHPGFDKGRGYLSEIGDKISAAEQAIGERIKGAGQRWGERLAPITDKYSAREKEVQRLEGLPAAYAAAMESGAPMPSVNYEPTISGEDVKRKQQQENRTKEQEARVAEGEKTNKDRRASVSAPSANPVRLASASGIPGLEPIPAEEERKKVAAQAGRDVEAEFSQPSTPAQAPEQRAIAQQIVESKLTADQQIAALAKYFQTDTSEAMRIKGEMEKESAHAGNVGIMAVLANALGMGLGTYGTGAARWGAGLTAAAQGMMSEEKAAAARQDEINKLRREIAESPNKQRNEAAKMYFDILREQGKLRSAEDIAREKDIQQQRLAEYNATNKQSQFDTSEANKFKRTEMLTGSRADKDYIAQQAQIEGMVKDRLDMIKDTKGFVTPEDKAQAMREVYEQLRLPLPSAGGGQSMGTRPIVLRSGIIPAGSPS